MQEYNNFCKLWMNCKLGILLFYYRKNRKIMIINIQSHEKKFLFRSCMEDVLFEGRTKTTAL